jgi:homoserine kinase type II
VRRQRYRNLRELSALHYPDLPDRVVHGDFHEWNLLFQDGQLSGLLDFDWCRRDALAADIASTLAPYSNWEAAATRSFLEGYEAVRQLDDSEWTLLPALMRAQMVHFCAFRLVEWKMLDSERAVASIARTVKERFAAVDAMAAAMAAEKRGIQRGV